MLWPNSYFLQSLNAINKLFLRTSGESAAERVFGPVKGPGIISFKFEVSYAPDKLDPGAIGIEKPEGEGTGCEFTWTLSVKKYMV